MYTCMKRQEPARARVPGRELGGIPSVRGSCAHPKETNCALAERPRILAPAWRIGHTS